MTDEQRRFMHARNRVEAVHINPVQELLAATTALIEAERKRADRAEQLVEQLRPVWAQGFTSDSQAAQANGNALAAIWKALGVTHQTAAMQAIRDMHEMTR